MSQSGRSSSLFAACRATYIQLEREVYRQGLNTAEIVRTREDLAEFRQGRWVLKEKAFRPTGLALGCPLPEKRQTILFARLSGLVECWLNTQAGASPPAEQKPLVFAWVPPDCYHITILNRSHYEFTTMQELLSGEKETIATETARLGFACIEVMAVGLVLTRSGRLFVKCLPVDDRIQLLRDSLLARFPQLGVNMPHIVHLKLGHLMLPLDAGTLERFEAWLRRLDPYAMCRLAFTDLYSPRGRITI